MSQYGLITGTGANVLRDLGVKYKEEMIPTPYGNIFVQVCEWLGMAFVHLNRHLSTRPLEENEWLMPFDIDARGNIWALASMGVRRINATTAVGSIVDRMVIGDVVMAHQMKTPEFDCRSTFADRRLKGRFGPAVYGPHLFRENVRPLPCEFSRRVYGDQTEGRVGQSHLHRSGKLSIVRGPRFETDLDIEILRSQGIEVVGMGTALPEAFLCTEVGICYTPAAIVTDNPNEAPEQSEIERVGKVLSPKLFEAAVVSFQMQSVCGGMDCKRPEAPGLRQAYAWAA